MDRDRAAGKARRRHRHPGVRPGRGVRVPAAGGALRELAVAAGGDPDRADVRAGGHDRRQSARARPQHPGRDRPGRAGGPGRQERHPDRGVRQAGARGRPEPLRRRGERRPHAAAAHPHDVARLHPGRGAAGGELRRRRRNAPVAGHGGVLRHAGRHLLRLDLHAGLLCHHHRAVRAALPLAQTRGAAGVQARSLRRPPMALHPALASGRVAVVTGAASGIGLAAARRFASMGLKVCMADLSADVLARSAVQVCEAAPKAAESVLIVPTDVSRLESVQALKEKVYERFGEVAVLMNNAGTSPGGGPWDHMDRWRRVLEVNLWGVIHGVQTFTPAMLAQKTPCAIVNTGSKQGITCPPGDTAYNVSKAGVKVLTEGLAHSLRNEEGARITAHLLIPGSTFTAMTSRGRAEKPAGAWTPDQVVDMLITGVSQGDFYVLCPDNEVTREVDARRILWAAQDITENRPALSRWHADYKDAFDKYLHAEK